MVITSKEQARSHDAFWIEWSDSEITWVACRMMDEFDCNDVPVRTKEQLLLSDLDLSEYEVTKNIHDNPELIK